MSSIMAKPKKRTPTVAGEPSGGIKPTSYRPAPDVHAAMNEYRDSFEYKPSYSDIIDRAMRMFLRSKGLTHLSAEPPE